MARSTSGPEAQIEKMIALAEQTIGWSDENNTKRTPVHLWYNETFGNPDPDKFAWDWCDGWITYLAHHTGNHQAVCLGNIGFAYTVAHANAFKAKAQWHDGADGIRRGDIVFFDWGQGIEHVGLVVGSSGLTDKISTIEGNTLNVVARRVRDAADVAGYGRPNYGLGVTTPAPTPEEPPVATAYKPPAFPKGLRPDSASPSARGLQKALKDGGYMAASIPYADNYGPSTQAAVAQFHKQHPALSEDAYDPEIGPKGWEVLHREAYGGAKAPSKPVPAPPATTPDRLPEPAHDYRRVTYGGKTVNVRTRTMLQAARGLMGLSGSFALTQGSYNRGVSASAGTHDGGGVVDLNTDGLNVNATLRALRKAGFAAWYRTPNEGFAYHIHACAIGDREMAVGALNQVGAYFRGRNGLANNGPDSAPASVGRPYPAWAERYR